LSPIKKMAIFLVTIGEEKAQRIIALMDNSEIKTVISEIRKLTVISQEMQEFVWTEIQALGYEERMTPPEVLTIMRFLFNGSKISR
jgi:flagellar motor switch protein FliG